MGDIKHGPTHAEVMMTSNGTPCLVELVSNFSGRIEDLPGYKAIKQLPSFNFMEVGSHIAIGQELELTIDLFTCAGAVILCHPSKKQVAEDEAKIRQMELDGSLFRLAKSDGRW